MVYVSEFTRKIQLQQVNGLISEEWSLVACFTANFPILSTISYFSTNFILFCQVFNLIHCLLRKDYLKLEGMNESVMLAVKQQSINESFACVSIQVLVLTVSLFKT